VTPDIKKRLERWRDDGDQLAVRADRHRVELADIVRDAKAAGIRANEVAAELGMSRQALSERVRKLTR
jgi:DNA-binding Lrp family transcriptional regulator